MVNLKKKDNVDDTIHMKFNLLACVPSRCAPRPSPEYSCGKKIRYI